MHQCPRIPLIEERKSRKGKQEVGRDWWRKRTGKARESESEETKWREIDCWPTWERDLMGKVRNERLVTGLLLPLLERNGVPLPFFHPVFYFCQTPAEETPSSQQHSQQTTIGNLLLRAVSFTLVDLPNPESTSPSLAFRTTNFYNHGGLCSSPSSRTQQQQQHDHHQGKTASSQSQVLS